MKKRKFLMLSVVMCMVVLMMTGCPMGGPSDGASDDENGEPNHNPVLSQAGVTPATGDLATVFTFTADYEDSDGDAPSSIQVFVDDTPADMTLAAGSAANGSYEYTTVLSAGSHEYYVSCNDGRGGTSRSPASGALAGPFVTGRALTGSVTYTGAAVIGASQPLRVDVWSDAGTLAASDVFVTSPGNFDFELSPGVYAVSASVDMDASGSRTEGDIFVLYNDTYQLHAPDTIDLTSGDEDIAITLTDDNVFGFLEDFEDGVADGWIEEPPSQWSVALGLYYMTGTFIDDVTVAVAGDDDVSDFTFRCAGLELVSGNDSDADWGVIFRLDANTYDGYTVTVDTEGNWGLYRISGGFPTLLHFESTFDEGDAITVRCVGDSIEVYVNDTLEWTETDDSYASGYVGFYAWDDTSPAFGGPQVFAFGDTWLVHH